MKLEAGKKYRITIPETEFFVEEVKDIEVIDKSSIIWDVDCVNYDKIGDDQWYYVYDVDRDKKHWYKINNEHLIKETTG